MNPPAAPADLRLYSAAQLSKLWSVSDDVLYQAARRGELPCIRLGKRVLFRESDLIAFLQSKLAPTNLEP